MESKWVKPALHAQIRKNPISMLVIDAAGLIWLFEKSISFSKHVSIIVGCLQIAAMGAQHICKDSYLFFYNLRYKLGDGDKIRF